MSDLFWLSLEKRLKYSRGLMPSHVWVDFSFSFLGWNLRPSFRFQRPSLRKRDPGHIGLRLQRPRLLRVLRFERKESRRVCADRGRARSDLQERDLQPEFDLWLCCLRSLPSPHPPLQVDPLLAAQVSYPVTKGPLNSSCQCYKSFNGLFWQVNKGRAVIKISCSHKCQIKCYVFNFKNSPAFTNL